jgi:hypothetical protein
MHSETYEVRNGKVVDDGPAFPLTYLTEEFRVHHNGDYSGDVWFTGVSPNRVEFPEDSLDVEVIKLPYELLEKIVMDKVRREMINRLMELDESSFKSVLKALL